MKTLVLDCAFKPTVAIVDEKQDFICLVNETENHSDTYMKLIDEALKKSNLSINDVTQIAVNVGPGSFTGLRVGVSIAKGFGFGSKVKYLKFSSFDYINNDNILVSGFSSFVYLKQGRILSCEDMSLLNKDLVYVTFQSDLCDKLISKGFNVNYENKLKYFEIVNKIKSEKYNMNELEPLYLRKSQAEIEREIRENK